MYPSKDGQVRWVAVETPVCRERFTGGGMLAYGFVFTNEQNLEIYKKFRILNDQ